jgi:hypothetical protein
MKSNWIRTTVLLALLLVLVPLTPGSAIAQEPMPLTPDQAREAALERLQTQVELGYTPEWKEATLDEAIYLYDLAGTVTAYLFPVRRDGQNAGYLTAAALAIPNPVIEFSPNAPPPLWAKQTTAKTAAMAEGTDLCLDQPLYLGVLSYGYELVPAGRCDAASSAAVRRFVDLYSGTVVEVDARLAMVPLSVESPLADSMGAEDLVTALAYNLISGVPDYCQFKSGSCWSGCAPTASANVLGYWDAHGYPNLQSGGNWQQLVLDLGNYMSTSCGSTNIGNISSGMVNYARARGYYFESELYWPAPSYDLFCSEIDAGHPLVVDLIGAAEYWWGNHSVTGIGYQTDGSYMIVNNALACGVSHSHYIHYGSGYYSSIGMHPTRPDTTPPSKAFNVRPFGWSGPYTNDNTPTFAWDAATDASGIQGYYVAVDDWTPEGSYGNDWWAGNVTAFTVPEAQSDGQHVFAVTSVDNAGNVNPPNTNQQGDAPYYTFYVDTTSPTNPTTADSGCSAQNGVWQNTCNDPNFAWSGATDATSGVAGYQVYWGADPNGTTTFWTTSPGYNPSAVDTGTYYLRVRTKDRVGNWSNWKTLYTFRYDDLAPSGSFSFSGGELSHTINTLLNLDGTDVGSGVSKVRLSNNGTDWTEKEYAQQVHWTIPTTDGQWHTVYLRFVDAAGNVSPVYQQQICLDLTPPKPSSASYRLWPAGQIAGGGYASASYRLYHTEGQPFARNPQISSHYRLHSGFQATWPASPGAELFTADGCAAPPGGGIKVYLPIVIKNQ